MRGRRWGQWLGRLVLAMLVFCLSACASAPPAPIPAAAVRYGVNDGYHGPIPPAIVDHYCGYGGRVTVRSPQVDVAGLEALVASLARCATIDVLLLIEGADVGLAGRLAGAAAQWPIVRAIELGNELELAPAQLTPAAFGAWIRAASTAVRAAGFRGQVMTGGVYALTAETQAAIVAGLQACAECAVAVHLYEPPDAAAIAWLRARRRPIAVTEFGMPTGCGPAHWAAQAAYWTEARQAFAQIPAAEVIGYQRPSGADCSNLATFGLEVDGAWKPADAILGGWLVGQ